MGKDIAKAIGLGVLVGLAGYYAGKSLRASPVTSGLGSGLAGYLVARALGLPSVAPVVGVYAFITHDRYADGMWPWRRWRP